MVKIAVDSESSETSQSVKSEIADLETSQGGDEEPVSQAEDEKQDPDLSETFAGEAEIKNATTKTSEKETERKDSIVQKKTDSEPISETLFSQTTEASETEDKERLSAEKTIPKTKEEPKEESFKAEESRSVEDPNTIRVRDLLFKIKTNPIL